MRLIQIITLLVLTISFDISAQSDIVIDKIEIKDQERPASSLVINIPLDDARAYYEEVMEETHGLKVKGNGFLSNKDILCSEQVTIASVSSKTIDIYATFREIGEESTRVVMTAREGYDLFYSDAYEPESLRNLQLLLQDVVQESAKRFNEALLEEEQDKLKDSEKRKRALLKSIEKHEDAISENLKENKKMEKEIEEYKQELESNASQLKDSNERIENVQEKLDKDSN